MSRNHWKRLLNGAAALALTVGLLAGCGGETSLAGSSTQGSSQTNQSQPFQPEIRQMTDMAGRTVEVPTQIDGVFSTGPVAAIYLYTLAPDQLLGWNYALNDIEKSIILEQYHHLPNFGMGDAVNYEAVLAAQPQVALHVAEPNQATVDQADQLSRKLGVPVVVVDDDLRKAPEVYRFLGELLGEEDRAAALADYAQETFDAVSQLDVPQEERVRVYFGNGEDSLETAPAGTGHGQILDLVGAINVAEVESGDGSRVQVSPEHLLAWDPDVILVNGEPKASLSGSSAAQALMEDPRYQSLQAVQSRQVYGTPNAPFSWVDRPVGPNRIVGVRWLSGLLYPQQLDFDVDTEVKEFFDLFYHVTLTDDQLAQLYQGTL